MIESRFKWADAFVLEFSAAKEFYENLFGWSFFPQHAEHGVMYSLACLDGNANPPESTVVAGLAECADAQRKMNYWNSYVTVASVDDAVGRVQDANGSVYMEPMDVMTAGRMAVCADDQGVVFHLWEAIDHSGSQISNRPNSICWYELAVSDLSKAVQFYGTVFSWSVSYREMSSGKYALFKSNGNLVCGAHDQLSQTNGVECWLPYFQTEDLNNSLNVCKTHKGTVICEVLEEAEIGRYAIAADCENNMFGLVEFRNAAK